MPIAFNAPSRTTLPSYQSTAQGAARRFDPFGNIIGSGAVDRPSAPTQLQGLKSILPQSGNYPSASFLFPDAMFGLLEQGNPGTLFEPGGPALDAFANFLGQDIVGGGQFDEMNPLRGYRQRLGHVYASPSQGYQDIVKQFIDPESDDAKSLLNYLASEPQFAEGAAALRALQDRVGEARTAFLNPGAVSTYSQRGAGTYFPEFRTGPQSLRTLYGNFLDAAPELLPDFLDPLPARQGFSLDQFSPVIEKYNQIAGSLAGDDNEASNRAAIAAQNLAAAARGNEQARQREIDTLNNALAQSQAGRTAISDRYQDQSYKNLNQFFGNLQKVDLDAEDRMARIDQDYGDLTDRFRAREQQALSLLSGRGGTQLRELARRQAEDRAAQQARNISSGLTNTTVASAQDRRLRQQAAEQYGDLQQRLTEQQLGILGQFTGDTLRTAQAGLQAREPINQAALQAQIAGLGRGADAADTITRTAAELEGRTADVGDAWMQALAQSQRDQALTGQQLANLLLQAGQTTSFGV